MVFQHFSNDVHIYDINHIYALQIKNTSESDPRSCKENPEKILRLQWDSSIFSNVSHQACCTC